MATLLILALSAAACRSKQESRVASDAGSLTVDGVTRTRVSRRFRGPLGAARWGSDVLVFAQDRDTRELASVLLRGPDHVGQDAIAETTLLGNLPTSVGTLQARDLVAIGSTEGAGLLVSGLAESGAAKTLLVLRRDKEGRPIAEGPLLAGEAVCANASGIATLDRTENGWRGHFRSFAAPARLLDGPEVLGRSEGVLVCGRERVFLLASRDEVTHAVAWDPSSTKQLPSVVLAKPDDAGNEDDVAVTSDGESLLIVRMTDNAAVSLLTWKGEGPPDPWVRAQFRTEGESALEAVEATRDAVGLVITQPTDGSKPCPEGAETGDTVLRAGLLGRDGRVLHAFDRLETWRCGREAGPFFAGFTGARFQVVWARVADATCAKAGARYGGFAIRVLRRVPPEGRPPHRARRFSGGSRGERGLRRAALLYGFHHARPRSLCSRRCARRRRDRSNRDPLAS